LYAELLAEGFYLVVVDCAATLVGVFAGELLEDVRP
jgi:hypothetical protein